jgi:phenylacetate-CoA ligase
MALDPYGTVYRFALFPAWEALMGRPTLARMRYLEQTQWLPREDLVARQTASLRRLLWHAYDHVPYFKRTFRERGVSPKDVRTVEDVRHLPILSRAAVRTSLEERTSAAPPFPTIRKTTSGSTGTPITIAYDEESEHWRQGVKWRGYGWARFRPGDRVMHYWGPPQVKAPLPKRAKISVDRFVRRELYVDCVAQSEIGLMRAVKAIRTFRPAVIITYAQAGGNLARFINKHGHRDWDEIPVICTAEQLFPHDRVEIEAAFGNQVYNSYGGRETMLLAMECEAHDGLHVSHENILLEVLVTEESGAVRAARAGETGEVVVTDLHNFGAPLIRYANGDLAKVMSDGPCACGRALPRLSAVEGRKADTLVDGYGGQVHGMIFPVLMLPLAEAVQQYQAVQHKDRSLTVRIVPTPKFDERARRLILESLERTVRGIPIAVELTDNIPCSASGKRRPVIVEA